MNAERLHAIAEAIQNELATTQSPELVAQLTTALTAQVQNPTDPSFQQSVSVLRSQLDASLAGSASNGFSPAWREAVAEMGIADLLGERLRESLEAIFTRNEITPATAADEIGAISTRLNQLRQAVEQLLAGLSFLNIGAERLGPGEFEIGVLIPRDAVDNDFGELGEEFEKLDRTLKPLIEIATGSRPSLKVRSISSSGFQAFLNSSPAAALLIAKTIETLVNSYEKVRKIRDANKQLRDQGVPDDALKTLVDHANGRMEEEIEKLADETLAPVRERDEARANELRKELVMSLNAIANRIDRGYSIEVRAGELPPIPEDADDEDDVMREAREAADAIASRQRELQFMNLTGRPILSLEEGNDGDESGDDGDSDE